MILKPGMKGNEVRRILERNGFKTVNRNNGHVNFIKGDKRISLPAHGAQPLSLGLIHKFDKIIRESA